MQDMSDKIGKTEIVLKSERGQMVRKKMDEELLQAECARDRIKAIFKNERSRYADAQTRLHTDAERIRQLERDLELAQNENKGLRQSMSWRLTRPMRKVLDMVRPPQDGGQTLACIESDPWDELEQWLQNTPHNFIDIFHVAMGWNTPLFQRFQQLSLQMGNIGGISIYGGHPSIDGTMPFKIITPTLGIFNADDPEVRRRFFEIMDKMSDVKIIRLQSIDLATTKEEIESFIERGYSILYEYIDEITPQIVGSVPDFVYERHEYIMRNTSITVVATSDKLFKQTAKYRRANMRMIPNGVDYYHWNIDKSKILLPLDLLDVVASGKIVVGYHGALAQWIDYDLLKRIAEDGQYAVLLIGHAHDKRMQDSGLLEYDNVYYLGSKSYFELNQYAAFYDIGILPFILNDITLSVSPVKIFEYMAAGKPVVSYALPECKKYKSCLCAETPEEFMTLLEDAVSLMDDEEYRAQLHYDAVNNSWRRIAQETVELVVSNMENIPTKAEKYARYHLENDRLSVLRDPDKKTDFLNQVLRVPEKPQDDYVGLTNAPYEMTAGDAKVIAYYLTQFHPDKHNEEWWGRGVTEWNNVSRAVPQFYGHYQPRLPGELGYYDLRIRDNMARQIELAQMYGIFGFSFYYYWFNGERLLEKPLEMFLSDTTLDFPFSLCWANENWTRRFDGTSHDILMGMPCTEECYERVITDMARFLADRRYITVKGAKMITVYRPSLMPNAKEVLQYWRDYCKKQGLGELYLIAVVENGVKTDWLAEGYDAVSEFHPGTLYTNMTYLNSEIDFIRSDFRGEVFSYPDIVENQKYFRYNTPKMYRAVMPMWDNTARRNNKGFIIHGSTPALYKRWLEDVIREEQNREDLDDVLVFINAWNEWGEGTYLEPDARFGYAYLEATKEAVEETRKDSK